VAPQAPSQADSRFIRTGRKYTGKIEADSPVPSPVNRERTSPPIGLILGVVGALVVVGGLLFILFGHKTMPVANGSFETPVTNDHIYTPFGDPWMYSTRNGDNGSGVAADRDAFTDGNPPAPQGRQVAFLQGKGTSISQVVPGFTPGKHYTIKFAAAQRANFAQRGQTWDVTINGITVKSFAPPQADNAYVAYSAGFTADTAVCTVAFVATDINGGDNTVFLDDVRITRP
jgi:hypothetical protein